MDPSNFGADVDTDDTMYIPTERGNLHYSHNRDKYLETEQHPSK